MPGMPFTLSGDILISATTHSFSGAQATVRLEDVSRLDAPAQVIAQQVIDSVAHDSGQPSSVHFALEIPPLELRSQYNLRVHVDLDGDGDITRGDLITMESYPLPDRRYPSHISVRVHPVGEQSA